MTQKQAYGVSFGNGNDGVSHMDADYYVHTDDPWHLAEAAMIASFATIKGRNFASKHVEIDGDAEHTISAVIYDPPGDTNGSWCDANGAWLICEVFPVEDTDPSERKMIYRSVGAAVGPAVVRRLKRKAAA